MTRLFSLLFAIVSPTLMGVLIIAALTTGHDTLRPIILAAATGFAVAIPVSWALARRLAG